MKQRFGCKKGEGFLNFVTICDCGNGKGMTDVVGGRVESSVVLLEPTDSSVEMNTGHRRKASRFSGLMPHFFDFFLCCFLCAPSHTTPQSHSLKPEPRFRLNSLTPPASHAPALTRLLLQRARAPWACHAAGTSKCCESPECCLWWRRDCGFGGSGRWALKSAGWLEASSRSSQASAPRAPAHTTHTRACGNANGRLISNNLSYTNLTPL
jgi:hypothetical protein